MGGNEIGKSSTRAKNKYNAKNYDSLRIVVPKGAKEALEREAKREGKSVNGLVNDLLADKLGVKSLKVYSVQVAERESIISGIAGRPMDDEGLRALDGLRFSEEIVISETKEDAEKEAAELYNKRPPVKGFYPNNVQFIAKDLGEIENGATPVPPQRGRLK